MKFHWGTFPTKGKSEFKANYIIRVYQWVEGHKAELREIAREEDSKSLDEKRDTGGLVRELLGDTETPPSPRVYVS